MTTRSPRTLRAIGLCLFLLPFFTSYSQQNFKGKILTEDERPIAFATVGVKGKNAGCIADSSGNFRLQLPYFIKQSDTVIISCIGFQSLRMPVREALTQSAFLLPEAPKIMAYVTVNSQANENEVIQGSHGDSTSMFFRGWYERRTGGEIGKIFNMPYKQYRLERVRFKADNKCDTCFIRLHIRKVENDMPGDELITSNIIIPFTKLNVRANNPSFSLWEYDIQLSESRIFVGFEILDCSYKNSLTSSFCFVGSEEGEYLYKTYANSPWLKDHLSNLEIKLNVKY